MAKKKFTIKLPKGQTVPRKLYLVLGNAGTAEAPDYHPIGKRVEESSADNDYGDNTRRDILGNVFGDMKEPITTQDFDPCPVDPDDAYQQKLIQLHIVDRDVQALANQDLIRAHLYLTDDEGNAFAERFPASMVKPNGPGGEGGGSMTMPVNVTFGGEREVGTVKLTDGKYVFTPGIDEGE